MQLIFFSYKAWAESLRTGLLQRVTQLQGI